MNVPPSPDALGFGRKTAEGREPPPEASLFPLLAETLVINDALVRFPKPVSLRFLGEVREIRVNLTAGLDYVSPGLEVNVRTLRIEDGENNTNGMLKVEVRGSGVTDGERYGVREAVVESPLGSLRLKGKTIPFGELDLIADARFTPDGIPSGVESPFWAVPAEIGAEVKGPWDRPSILAKIRFPSEKAEVEGVILPDAENPGSFDLEGMFHWDDLRTWFGRFEGIPPDEVPLGGLRGTFSFKLGSNRPPSGTVEISSVDWDGNGDEGFLRELKAAILLNQGEIRLDNCTVDSGFGRAVMNGLWTGGWGEDWAARFRIDLDGSGAFFQDMKVDDALLDLKLDGEELPFGPVRGNIAVALEGFVGSFQDRPSVDIRDVRLDTTISGSFVEPLVRADLSAKKAARGELDLGDIRFDLNWAPDRADYPGEINGAVRNIRVGDHTFDKNSLNGRFSSDRIRFDRLTIKGPAGGAELSGLLDFPENGTWAFSGDRLAVEPAGLGVWNNSGPFRAGFGSETGADVRVELVRKDGKIGVEGAYVSRDRMKWKVRARRIDIARWLEAFKPDGLKVEGVMDLDFDHEGTPEDAASRIEISVENGAWGDLPVRSATVKGRWDNKKPGWETQGEIALSENRRFRWKGTVVRDPWSKWINGSKRINGPAEGPVGLSVRWDAEEPDLDFWGTRIDPDLSISGRGKMSGTIEGSLDELALNSRIQFDDVRVAVPDAKPSAQ